MEERMSTRAIVALVKIIKHPGYPLRAKLEAVETLLGFETREDVVEFAQRYLASVYEWEGGDEPGVSDRLWALKLARQLEAPKIRPETVVRREEAKTDTSTEEFIRGLDERSRLMKEHVDKREAFAREYAPQIAKLQEQGIVVSLEEYKALLTGQSAKSP
jgi:hypothetical protein